LREGLDDPNQVETKGEFFPAVIPGRRLAPHPQVAQLRIGEY
jgi:hypothetical protein